jgi:hypothetical protein
MLDPEVWMLPSVSPHGDAEQEVALFGGWELFADLGSLEARPGWWCTWPHCSYDESNGRGTTSCVLSHVTRKLLSACCWGRLVVGRFCRRSAAKQRNKQLPHKVSSSVSLIIPKLSPSQSKATWNCTPMWVSNTFFESFPGGFRLGVEKALAKLRCAGSHYGSSAADGQQQRAAVREEG